MEADGDARYSQNKEQLRRGKGGLTGGPSICFGEQDMVNPGCQEGSGVSEERLQLKI